MVAVGATWLSAISMWGNEERCRKVDQDNTDQTGKLWSEMRTWAALIPLLGAATPSPIPILHCFLNCMNPSPVTCVISLFILEQVVIFTASIDVPDNLQSSKIVPDLWSLLWLDSYYNSPLCSPIKKKHTACLWVSKIQKTNEGRVCCCWQQWDYIYEVNRWSFIHILVHDSTT